MRLHSMARWKPSRVDVNSVISSRKFDVCKIMLRKVPKTRDIKERFEEI